MNTPLHKPNVTVFALLAIVLLFHISIHYYYHPNIWKRIFGSYSLLGLMYLFHFPITTPICLTDLENHLIQTIISNNQPQLHEQNN